jgi:hypothetical protein
MKTTPIARRLGLDGNPLRRRIDKIAACAAALLLAVFGRRTLPVGGGRRLAVLVDPVTHIELPPAGRSGHAAPASWNR